MFISFPELFFISKNSIKYYRGMYCCKKYYVEQVLHKSA